jgi:hypothetical protein
MIEDMTLAGLAVGTRKGIVNLLAFGLLGRARSRSRAG